MNHRHAAFILAAALFLMPGTGLRAGLQWINGGVPQGTQASPDGVVRDAPDNTDGTDAAPGTGIVLCHLTTCTKLAGQYPADSVNYFYLNKHTSVSYFAYFLMKPTTRIHTAIVEWINPAGNRIARYEQEFRVGFTDRLLTVQNETYQWFLLSSTIGVGSPNAEARQSGLPRDPGLYTVNLTVDGQLAGITFFYMKSQEPDSGKNAGTSQSPGAAGAAPYPPMSLSTPTSNAPLLPAMPKR